MSGAGENPLGASIHGPPLGLALAGLGLDPKPGLELAGSIVRHVCLDASAPGVRARELGRSARRDLAASLRRRELGFAGLDLWIPARHFAEPETRDRATAAAVGAVELSKELAELATGVARLCVAFPAQGAEESTREINAIAERAGVTVCDANAWRADSGVATLDAAAALMADKDPAALAARLGDRLGCARYSDATAAGRCVVGRGDIDTLSYRVALATAGHMLPVVIDCRGLDDGPAAARRAAEAWGAALPG